MVDRQDDVNPYERVKSVKQYLVVPKTNPEYWTEPKGLMFISEKFYDEKGREIKRFCKNCDVASHGPSCDVVEKYYYAGDELVKIRREGRDTIETEIKVFKDKQIKVEYLKAKGNFVGLNYVTMDKFDKEVRRVNLDFSYFNEINSYNVGYSIIDNKWSGDENTANKYRGQFSLNKNAASEIAKADLSNLQAIVSDYYMKFMSYKDNYHDSEDVSVYEDGKLLKTKTGYFGYYKNRIDSNLYFYDSKGLLVQMKVHYGVYDGDYRYVYSFRE